MAAGFEFLRQNNSILDQSSKQFSLRKLGGSTIDRLPACEKMKCAGK